MNRIKRIQNFLDDYKTIDPQFQLNLCQIRCYIINQLRFIGSIFGCPIGEKGVCTFTGSV